MAEPRAAAEHITRVLREEVAPALDMDGQEIEVIEVKDGVVQVRVKGACGGCPSSIMSWIMLLEEELRKRVPQVEYLELVP